MSINTYCGQEPLRRNGVALIVNKRVQNAVLGYNIKSNRMLFISKANHSISQYSKSMHQPLMLKKPKLIVSLKTQKTFQNNNKRCPFHHRGLEYKSWKSRHTWRNRTQSTKCSKAKANRVLSIEHTSYSKHPFPTSQDDSTHRHHQMVNTEIREIIFFAAKMEKLYTVSKNKTC